LPLLSAFAREDAVVDESLANKSETLVRLFTAGESFIVTGEAPLKVGILLALIGAGELFAEVIVTVAI
jgi:hypothetical protein